MHSTFTDDSHSKAASSSRPGWRKNEVWLYVFLITQFICQCGLMAEQLGGRSRTYFRAATFVASLAMLFFLPGRSQMAHPASRAAMAILGWMGVGLLHPYANTLSGIAHWVLNIAIWAPLFWVGRVAVNGRVLWNAVLLLWAFHTVSSVIGVLQVYYPERFAPTAEFVRVMTGQFAQAHQITLGDGKQIWRPFGLSDSPGGAASSGSFAVLAGMLLLINRSGKWVGALALGGITAGVFCIYICEIRSVMIITVLGVGALAGLLVLQRRLSRSGALLLVFPMVVIGGISWTNSISGGVAAKRVKTISEEPITTVYYTNRGRFLEYSIFDELPAYPLGAGLGRYGMMYTYFGDPNNSNARGLWAEIQLTAWLYDGGLPLILLAYGAIVAACYYSLKIAIDKRADPLVTDCATLITALNIGWLTVTFNYPIFLSQTGMMFWLLNGALFVAYRVSRPKSAQPAGLRHVPSHHD